jgi:aspartyl-tRNA(Asn)/glutamyl-tRNA(Gln) amidotransferase subunit B
LLRRIQDGTLSGKLAKEVFEAMWRGEGDTDRIIEHRGLHQITDSSELEALVDRVIAEAPGQVAQYRAGREKLMGFFVGQVMKATGGKANPQQVNELLRRKLAP